MPLSLTVWEKASLIVSKDLDSSLKYILTKVSCDVRSLLLENPLFEILDTSICNKFKIH